MIITVTNGRLLQILLPVGIKLAKLFNLPYNDIIASNKCPVDLRAFCTNITFLAVPHIFNELHLMLHSVILLANHTCRETNKICVLLVFNSFVFVFFR